MSTEFWWSVVTNFVIPILGAIFPIIIPMMYDRLKKTDLQQINAVFKQKKSYCLITLYFKKDNKLREDYFNHMIEKATPQITYAVILGGCLYAAFTVLDRFVISDPFQASIASNIRLGVVVCGVIYLGIFSLLRKDMRRFYISADVIGLIAGAGIILLIVFTGESNYYAGLMLVIIWLFIAFRLRFFDALVISYVLVFLYIVSTNSSKVPIEPGILINNLSFLIGTIFICALDSYVFERNLREEFLQKHNHAAPANLAPSEWKTI